MPRGLSLMLAANPCWLYQDDPFLHLEMKKAMRHIRAKVDDHQPIFSDIVNRYLVQNSCRASVELIPDPALGAEQERLERDTLDQIRASITLDEFEQIKVAQTELLAHQSSTDPPEVLNLIPRLQLSDLEPAISTTPRRRSTRAQFNASLLKAIIFVSGHVCRKFHAVPGAVPCFSSFAST